jgi:phosphoserine phosphatase
LRPTLIELLSSQEVPLVVDFDGTVCCADTLEWLRERCLSGAPELEEGRVRARALNKQAEKVYLWHKIGLPVDELPYDGEILDAIRAVRATNRRLILATGSARGLAEAVAGHLGLFDDVMGTDESLNMTGVRKSGALQRVFGQRGFDYLGDSPADVPVWQAARAGVFVHRNGSPDIDIPANVTRVASSRSLQPFPADLRLQVDTRG